MNLLNKISRLFLLPFFIYLVALFLFCPSILTHFRTHFITDDFDGLQNIWNLWWAHKALITPGLHLWFTHDLEFPLGTSLRAQTLVPFNGMVGAVLQQFFSLIETYNLLFVFSFAVGGLTAFFLCLDVTGAYWASLAGGAVFTFSNYHFAHAQGHMQLVALEWLPLFVLLWRRFAIRPSVLLGLSSALALLLTQLCDYYYFFYCVLFGIIYVGYQTRIRKDFFYLFRRRSVGPFISFLVLSGASCGVLAIKLMNESHRDPFSGAHSAHDFSMDLLSPFVPSMHWYWGSITHYIWKHWSGDGNEMSVFLGFSIIIGARALWKKIWIEPGVSEIKFWFYFALGFGILSLGPSLHIWGGDLKFIPLPYELLTWIFPPLDLSGCPVRMMVMVELALSIIVAESIHRFYSSDIHHKKTLVLLAALWVFEMYPRPFPLTAPKNPHYVQVLKELPSGPVLDLVSPEPWSLFYQTIHGKPMALGYITRVPQSVSNQNEKIQSLIQQKNWKVLIADYGFRYFALPELSADLSSLKLVYHDANSSAWIYQASTP